MMEEVMNLKTVQKAMAMANKYTPIFEAINSFKERGSFTVREIGEMLMGASYLQKVPYRYGWRNEKVRLIRTEEARSMTSCITTAVYSLVKTGKIACSEVKDMAHPYTFEVEGYYYCDQNGKALPDITIVTLPDGSECEVDTKNLRGVRRVKGKHTETKYSTYTLFTFAN